MSTLLGIILDKNLFALYKLDKANCDTLQSTGKQKEIPRGISFTV